MTTSCPSCAAPASGADRFCGRCGTRLGASQGGVSGFCTRCGSALAPAARFCASCGADQSTETKPSAERATVPHPAAPAWNGNGIAREDEDLLAEWEDAVRLRRPTRAEDPAITETIVRTPPGPVTEAFPLPAPALPTEPDPFWTDETAVRPVPPVPPPVPASPPRPEPSTPFRFPLGATVALLGAVAVIVSAVLPWDGAFRASLPRDIAAARLLDPGAGRDGVTLGIVLLMVGTIGALMALTTMAIPVLKPLRRLVGLMSLSFPVLFAFRTGAPLLAEGEPAALWSALGAGVYVAAAGAFVQVVAGRWFRR